MAERSPRRGTGRLIPACLSTVLSGERHAWTLSVLCVVLNADIRVAELILSGESSIQ